METGNSSSPDRRPMSQINVTPLVDVMLVLLIIFIVTAPMMTAGIDVNLPKVEASAVSAKEEPIVITIDRYKRVYMNDRALSAADLRTKLDAIHRNRPGVTVLLNADESVPYGHVMSAMADIRKAGIEKVGMMTEPLEGKR
jgi:biopolymer transport protein TolR